MGQLLKRSDHTTFSFSTDLVFVSAIISFLLPIMADDCCKMIFGIHIWECCDAAEQVSAQLAFLQPASFVSS